MLSDKSISLDHLTLGVCYYPEHWDESLWENDLERMQEHGIEVVRVFEFAWNLAEPTDGVFTFDLFDRFLELAQRKGMQVILCTPTATPPAWLTHNYPEVLNADIDGRKMNHGHRRHYNYNSPVYHRYTERIVTKLAQRYGDHPAVIGWQIDNEINCEINVFYSDSDRAAFRQYLQSHFGTLEALNTAIGATFWNQTYTDWAQVDLARPNANGTHNNPHMALLEKRFFSKSAAGYVKLQSDILRKYVGQRFITTNGLFGHLDNAEMTQTALDFITYDSYPNFAYTDWGNGFGLGPLRDRTVSWSLSQVRSISPNFGVMEQQSGANGWDFRLQAPMPKPGQLRLWTYQSIAHGADFVSYFRWRSCAFGTEIYWLGLNDYSNKPNRRLSELKKLHGELKQLAGVASSRYKADMAVAHDYLNEWDGERDKFHGPVDVASVAGIFAAAQHAHAPLDMVHIRHTNTHDTTLDELKRYRLIFYPHPTILTENTAALLKAYVQAGGILILGARTGYKDEYGRCPMFAMPGFARELCGVEVTDYTLTRADEPEVTVVWDGEPVSAPIFHDILMPVEGGEALACFTGGYYDGACALAVKRYPGGGAAYYWGGGFGEDTGLLFLRKLGFAQPYADVLDVPKSVELSVREKAGVRYYFLLNYGMEEAAFTLRQELTDGVSGQAVKGKQALEPYGVRVLKM
ncbi:MAG: beta-galactosidase [Clostridia bacterium]|nr:beta-galactosidase [Clostridia bacterium]